MTSLEHSHSAAGQHAGALRRAIAVSLVLLVVELLAAGMTGSLALLADAGHVFADISGMALSLGAVWLARRPPTDERSFGLYRLEILAAAANAVLLLGIAILIVIGAIGRLSNPPEIDSALVVVVALVAIALNLVALRFLRPGGQASLTVRGAYLEVAGDLLGAGAVLVSGLVILAGGPLAADALASIAVAALIVPRTVSLLRESIDVLLEATPRGVDLGEVERHVLEAPGVVEVHDLHVWTITSGMRVVSAHVVLAADAQPGDVLDHLGMCLTEDFDIAHSTFQLETPEHVRWEARSAQPQH